VGRRVELDKGGADLLGLGRRLVAEITRAAESRGDRGREEEDEDRFAKSQKCRDPIVML
jgi:hypothetical protein